MYRRTHSTANSVTSDMYSDGGSELSFHSGISGGGSIPGITRQTSSEALSSKSLELQRKMLLQTNTRLAEDLKNEKKNVMIIKGTFDGDDVVLSLSLLWCF